jgi:hypothetical protein
MTMDAEKFLKDSNLSSIADGDTLGLKVVYEDDVIYLMEKYHQSKVNNGVLDDVSQRYTIEDIEKCVENWGLCKVEKEYIEKFLNGG